MKISPRLLTALVGIPLVLGLVYVGGVSFKLFVTILALGAWRELQVAVGKSEDYGGARMVGSVGYVAILVAVWNGLNTFWAAGTLVALLAMSVLFYDSRAKISLAGVAMTLLCTLYVSLFAILPPLRETEDGKWFWLMLFCVWASDTAAYYTGRMLGKRKISLLSPGKTWEGFFGGFFGALGVGFFSTHWLKIEPAQGAALGALLGVGAPLGDLVESFFKRELRTKDFGSIFPGHGGILDRCDSILLCALVTYLFTRN